MFHRTPPKLSPIDSDNAAPHSRSMLSATNLKPIAAADTAHAEDTRATGDGLNECARAALGGDSFAVRKFLHGIAPLVRSVCRGVMGRGHPEIEDTIQDCLIDVVRALPQFRFEADISHYVTKITLRRAIALRERAQARAKRHVAIDLQTVPANTFDDGMEARAGLVRNLLDELNQSQATVLRLRLMLGHSIGEIASITGVSRNTVKTRLRLGKNQLRRWLKRSGETPRAR
jgi:RNA polymerase sigma factor (sigma-70 family)